MIQILHSIAKWQIREFAEYRRPRAILNISSAMLIMIVALGAVSFIIGDQHKQLADAQREHRNVALVLAEETDRSFRAAETLQDSLFARPGSGSGRAFTLMGGADFRRALQDKMATLPYLDALSIVDADGSLVNGSNVGPTSSISLSDRDYFKALSTDPSIRIFVGAPILDAATGLTTIPLARTIAGSHGNFAGVIVAAIKVTSLEAAYAALHMPQARVALMRADGVVLAAYPSDERRTGNATDRHVVKALQSGARTGTTIVGDRLDDASKLVAYRALASYPLSIVVGSDMSTVMADWRRTSTIIALLATAFALLFVAFMLLFGKSLDKERRNALLERSRAAAEAEANVQRALALGAAHFEVVLNSMLHGLCLFDADDRLVFCNRQYAEMYDLPAALTLRGVRWLDIVTHYVESLGDATLRGEIDEHRRSVDNGHEGTISTRTLRDGRTILVRYQMTEAGRIGLHEDITDRRKAKEHLFHMARHDNLTTLPNRVLFHERMDEAFGRPDQQSLAVICIDLDYFKETNDTLGHAIGDALLREIACRLKSEISENDTVARIGGDEFAVITRTSDAAHKEACSLAERILAALARPYDIDGYQIEIGASAGIAFAPTDGSSSSAVLRKADIALYRAKAGGRGIHCIFEAAMDVELQAQHALEVDMRKALDAGEFELHFQPLIDAESRAIRSFEALARWRHPQRGFISPVDFIPLAEKSGLIIPLGEWVLKTACAAAASWPDDIGVSVNLSACQFRTDDLPGMVAKVLAATGLAVGRLELEVTESVLLAHSTNNLSTLARLRDLGVRIALDDFGTGYSSLSYLHRFQFDKIKIDKSFIQCMERPESRAIVRAIAGIGKKLGIPTTAEGVETEEQLTMAIAKGCTEIQGYLFSRPIPAAQVASLIAGRGTMFKAA